MKVSKWMILEWSVERLLVISILRLSVTVADDNADWKGDGKENQKDTTKAEGQVL